MTLRSRGIATVTMLAMTSVLVVASGDTPAQAVSGSLWDPGNIVSDQQFYDADSMTQSQIQSFLKSKVPVCDTNHPASDGPFTCLKDYRETTVTKPADSYCTGTYKGASNELASTIIYKVAQACNISPKALLVTLQKEQGLVTNTWPSQYRYDKAMGFGCSDTAACIDTYKGFFKQVYMAARQFQRYRLLPTSYNYRVGSNSIHYHPPVKVSGVWTYKCPSQTVNIKNSATAGLYNYTPYVPNTAALNNMYGTGDSCSSYGNRNFWRYWWDWFGNPRATGALTNVTTSERISGANRYATAAALSATFDANPDVVYVASGENYPDALAVAPIAASDGAPLLLVRRDSIPSEVVAELKRLDPNRIVVLGGTGAISGKNYTALKGYAGAGGISRLGGVDRYETARIAIRDHWPNGSASLVYIASGRDYPDALSAAAAAGAQGAPVISVNGTAAHIDAETKKLIADLGATEIVIAGGTGAVSDGVKKDLAAIAGVAKVRRLGGSDRYGTSAAINADAFPTASGVYLASGGDFPDALAGAVRAGIDGAPLYIVRGTCIPSAVADSVNAYGPVKATLLGGTGVLPLTLSNVQKCK